MTPRFNCRYKVHARASVPSPHVPNMGGPDGTSTPKRQKPLGVRTRHGGAVNGVVLPGPPLLFTITPAGGVGRNQPTPDAISTERPPSAGFRVSPDEGVNLGKTGAVRQSIQAAGLIEDAGRVMQEFVADIFDPNPALDHITSALGMASVLLESSMGTSTGRSNMPGLGGQCSQRRALAAQDVLRRQTAALVDPHAAPGRSALEELGAKMCNMAAMGLERVDPAGPDGGMSRQTAPESRTVRKVSPGPKPN